MKIISGGQTGVDLAALKFAAKHDIPYGGWVPHGRMNEAGTIPACFAGLVETQSADPAVRTRLNVEAADATLILTYGRSSPGTELTTRVAEELGKPFKIADERRDPHELAAEIRVWLDAIRPASLNVAGPRESEAPGIGERMLSILTLVFQDE